MGEAGDDPRSPSCTTHLCVVDEAGTVVALTQTLLSLFGSKTVLPRTGILMNNGIMWFDPRPGGPNSIAPGRRPLSNMCPVIVERGDGSRIALGASGGRRILPAVLQLLSFLVDFRMETEAAFHQPRIDASGTRAVTVDDRLPDATRAALAGQFTVSPAPHGVYPALFACPTAAGRKPGNRGQTGSAFVMSPWAKASAADDALSP